MKTSPFPGMDPYLEHHWGDVHHRLITYASDQLQSKLPGDLRARVEERVFVESDQSNERSIYPDIRLIEKGQREMPTGPTTSTLAVAEPLILHVEDEPVTQGFIEIIDVGSGNRVVTVIEVLSPSNKIPGEGRELYTKKQRELKSGGVNLVEIDLLRSGKRGLLVAAERIPPSHRTTYQVFVRRGNKPGEIAIYRASIRERLPIFGIPLRETEADIPLDLQSLVDQCYVNGRYDDIDYTIGPNPPLNADDAAWADQLLREKGER